MPEEIMRTQKEIVQAAIIEGMDRKYDLLREFGLGLFWVTWFKDVNFI